MLAHDKKETAVFFVGGLAIVSIIMGIKIGFLVTPEPAGPNSHLPLPTQSPQLHACLSPLDNAVNKPQKPPPGSHNNVHTLKRPKPKPYDRCPEPTGFLSQRPPLGRTVWGELERFRSYCRILHGFASTCMVPSAFLYVLLENSQVAGW